MLIEAYNIYIFILRAHWGRNSGVMVDSGIYIYMYVLYRIYSTGTLLGYPGNWHIHIYITLLNAPI